ncbi:hypothetical protein BG454_11155 [Roseinatronobacter bogoriensis subsp. barguzinensis]|uniref:Uncharacterized protein n=2 Tax=Roseinatronobacter bogoriensis TaxID=119542 RepID=A0A2K8KEE1_9RHOB|nr:hypothetical protein BG454_11155 [Rhodobaca barguzinensis]
MWMKVFKHQHEAYLRVLGAVAEKIPHENAAECAREAEAVKRTVRASAKVSKPRQTKPAPKPAELVSA